MMYRAPRPLPSSGRRAPVSRPPALSVPERPTALRPGCAAKHYSGTSGKQACLSGTSVFTGLAEIEPTMQLGSRTDVMIATLYVPLSIPDSNSLPSVIRVEACTCCACAKRWPGSTSNLVRCPACLKIQGGVSASRAVCDSHRWLTSSINAA